MFAAWERVTKQIPQMFDALSNIYRHESRSLSKMAEGPQQNGSSVQEKKSESLLVQAWHSSNMAAPFPFCICCYQARSKQRHNKCLTAWAHLSKYSLVPLEGLYLQTWDKLCYVLHYWEQWQRKPNCHSKKKKKACFINFQISHYQGKMKVNWKEVIE